MRRIVLDVLRWHVFLHRDARALEMPSEKDSAIQKLEDELDRLTPVTRTGFPEAEQDATLRAWADTVHQACEALPAFGRLEAECRGRSHRRRNRRRNPDVGAEPAAARTIRAEAAGEHSKATQLCVRESSLQQSKPRRC